MIKLVPFSPSDYDELISWLNTEELLVTIAGTAFKFPLTRDQLQNYLELENSYSFTVFDTDQRKRVGHAQVILSDNRTFKIDKLIIGDKTNRGKGLGTKIITELLAFSFLDLNVSIVELNVFDWNIAGIQCYKKCGFIVNESKTEIFRVGDKNWKAINMVISKIQWSTSRATIA